ncbi:MAG: hypothetical protein KF774_00095 [Planctomyces sp.]|nr:hypothetical protein [Planctomyces sp.]
MAQREMPDVGDRPLISNATILILSGFLIGLTVGKLVADDLSPYVLSCGLSGFLAFIALEVVAERRHAEALRAEQDQITRRIDRHVSPATLNRAEFVSSEPPFFEDSDPAINTPTPVREPAGRS